MLTASISFLVYLIHKQSKLEEQKHEFKQETCRLFLILFTFDLTYLARLVFDKLIIKYFQTENLALTLVRIWIGLVFDILPVALILYIHSQNFRIMEQHSKPM